MEFSFVLGLHSGNYNRKIRKVQKYDSFLRDFVKRCVGFFGPLIQFRSNTQREKCCFVKNKLDSITRFCLRLTWREAFECQD